MMQSMTYCMVSSIAKYSSDVVVGQGSWNKKWYFIIGRKEILYPVDQNKGVNESWGYHYHYQVGYTMPLYVWQQWEMLIDGTLLVGWRGSASLRSEDVCMDMTTDILTWVVSYILFHENYNSDFLLVVCERLEPRHPLVVLYHCLFVFKEFEDNCVSWVSNLSEDHRLCILGRPPVHVIGGVVHNSYTSIRR